MHRVARNQAFFSFFFKHVFKNPGSSSRRIKEWNQGRDSCQQNIDESKWGGWWNASEHELQLTKTS